MDLQPLHDSPPATIFRIDEIDSASDQALDAAPFGVICIDADGTVLRYNLYEARLARLDANQVIGQDFFEDIARCTRGPGFEGHFRSVVAGTATEQDYRFDYVFDFAFGAQRVGVEIVSFPDVARYYLLINRTSVGAVRSQATELATLQRELAPNELELGVRRDELERRYVEVPVAFFAGLRATFSKLAPEAWPTFAHEWGVQWGRRAAIDLEAMALEGGNSSLGTMAMADVVGLAERYFDERGWGKLEFDFSAIREGLFEIYLQRSAMAEALPLTSLAAGSRPSCALVGGALAGLFSHVAARRLGAREIRCVSCGASACHFVVLAVERLNHLDDAIANSDKSIAAIRRAITMSPTAKANS
jgi:photoactive yellow protein